MQNQGVKIGSKKRPERSHGADWAMKRKAAVCATEAAVISIALHLLLLSFAGSMVILRFVREQAVAFKSENVERTALEKRAVQLPVKIQEMQKSGPRPNVKTRIVSATASPFTLPSMTLPESSYKIADSGEVPQSLSSHGMPSSLDIGITGVNFFGTRSSGEKFVFILDASKQMMEDAKGGYTTYKFAKDKIHQLVNAMPAATLFNVMVYNDSNVDMFRPQPVPATQAHRDALKAWLVPINSDPYHVGQVASKYRSPYVYHSDIGGAARGWLKAVQAAMEQTADNIFVLCASFGRYSISAPQSSVKRDEGRMEEYRAKLKAVNEKATQAFEAENEARASKGLPPKIIYDWNHYMIQELHLVLPDSPPAIGAGVSQAADRLPEDLVLDHMDAVWSYNYTPKELAAPRVNFVYLIAADASLSEGYLDITALRKMADAFRGDFEFLRGAKTMKNLTRYNQQL